MMANVFDSRLSLRTPITAQVIGVLQQFASDALGIGEAVGTVLG
jgi:hypothetical protein